MYNVLIFAYFLDNIVEIIASYPKNYSKLICKMLFIFFHLLNI